MYNVGTWNMYGRIHHYGMCCHKDCMSCDTFHINEWSQSNIFLLVIMCIFVCAKMLLVFTKCVKAYKQAAVWGNVPGADSGAPRPCPPITMIMLFAIVICHCLYCLSCNGGIEVCEQNFALYNCDIHRTITIPLHGQVDIF